MAAGLDTGYVLSHDFIIDQISCKKTSNGYIRVTANVFNRRAAPGSLEVYDAGGSPMGFPIMIGAHRPIPDDLSDLLVGNQINIVRGITDDYSWKDPRDSRSSTKREQPVTVEVAPGGHVTLTKDSVSATGFFLGQIFFDALSMVEAGGETINERLVNDIAFQYLQMVSEQAIKPLVLTKDWHQLPDYLAEYIADFARILLNPENLDGRTRLARFIGKKTVLVPTEPFIEALEWVARWGKFINVALSYKNLEVAQANKTALKVHVQENGCVIANEGGEIRDDGSSGSQVRCHLIDDDRSARQHLPWKVGVPFNVFSKEKEPIIQGLCSDTGGHIVVGSGSHIQLIYHRAHIKIDDTWQQVTLAGSKPAGIDGWFIGHAQAPFTASEEALRQGVDVLAYVCTWTRHGFSLGRWRCGCRTGMCLTHGSWQQQRLQRVRALETLTPFVWLDRPTEPIETAWESYEKMNGLKYNYHGDGYYPVLLEGKNVGLGNRYRARFMPFLTLPFLTQWDWSMSRRDFEKRKSVLEADGFKTIFENAFEACCFVEQTRYQAIWTSPGFAPSPIPEDPR